MSIVAGLCTRIVLTHEGQLGFNGAQVIESEAGVAEFDSSDHALILSVNGGAQRYATGLADALVLDDVPAVRHAVITAVAAGVPQNHRSEELDVLAARLTAGDGGKARFSLTSLGLPLAPSPGSARQRRAQS
jgi:malonate decarboxylase beta subunit